MKTEMQKKVLAILLSAVVAFGLWLYVITVVSPESEKTYYDIPVVLQNKNLLTERGLILVSDEPNVTLALKSDRTILNDLNESNINVIINLANIEKPGTHSLTYSITYPGNIPHNEVTVMSSSTDLITVRVENRIRKTVPVVLDFGDTAVPTGYTADKENAELDYTEIEVVGPESVINQISQAVIKVNLSNQTKTVAGEFQFALCDGQGNPLNVEKVTVNTEKVSLVVKVEKVKEIDLVLDIVDGGGATKDNCTITLDTTKIQISGSDILLEGIDSWKLGEIKLGEITEDQTLKFPIVLPEGVTNQTGVEEVTVEIKLPPLKTKTFSVKNITAINQPAGLRAEIVAKALQVKVRGPEALIDTMKETDISAVINLADAKENTVTRNAEIVFGDAFAGVGEMGTYPVTVNLK